MNNFEPIAAMPEEADTINVGNNTGQASPNWGFMSRYTIKQAGRDYLRRLRIIQTPLFGIYLHAILEPDAAEAPHDHPWSFITLMLKGEYLEHVFVDESQGYDVPMIRRERVRRRAVGQWAFRRKTTLHKVMLPAGRCRTLIFTGPRTRGAWGFSPEPGRWVHNTQYVERNEQGEITRDGR